MTHHVEVHAPVLETRIIVHRYGRYHRMVAGTGRQQLYKRLYTVKHSGSIVTVYGNTFGRYLKRVSAGNSPVFSIRKDDNPFAFGLFHKAQFVPEIAVEIVDEINERLENKMGKLLTQACKYM